jgi:uncharacterized protein
MVSAEDQLFEFVESTLAGTEMDAHALDHTRRVHVLAMELGRRLKADLRVLSAAAILHDVGRFREAETGVSHSKLSGEMSRPILENLGYSQEEVDRIVDAIRTHRFSEGLEPNSLEGRILSDADKLDALGAIGVYRSIVHTFAGGKGAEGFLEHAYSKLLKLKDLMHTDEARTIALARHETLERFVRQLRSQL